MLCNLLLFDWKSFGGPWKCLCFFCMLIELWSNYVLWKVHNYFNVTPRKLYLLFTRLCEKIELNCRKSNPSFFLQVVFRLDTLHNHLDFLWYLTLVSFSLICKCRLSNSRIKSIKRLFHNNFNGDQCVLCRANLKEE